MIDKVQKEVVLPGVTGKRLFRTAVLPEGEGGKSSKKVAILWFKGVGGGLLYPKTPHQLLLGKQTSSLDPRKRRHYFRGGREKGMNFQGNSEPEGNGGRRGGVPWRIKTRDSKKSERQGHCDDTRDQAFSLERCWFWGKG